MSCLVTGCTKISIAVGLCRSHYAKERAQRLQYTQCEAAGCDKPQYATGLCRGHYGKKQRKRVVETPTLDKSKKYVTASCRIPLLLLEQMKEQAIRSGMTLNDYHRMVLTSALKECSGCAR